MSDKVFECVGCGRTFVWSSGEQRYYKEHDLSPPKHCPACRSQRRHAGGSETHQAPGHSTNLPTSRAHKKRRASWWVNPTSLFGLVTFLAAVVLAALVLQFVHPLDALQSWLIAINLVAFLTYGYDKAIASSERTRVPEKVLLALTIAGGTIGAFVGMRLFHHKTSKGRFRLRFWLIAVAQIVLVAVYYLLLKP